MTFQKVCSAIAASVAIIGAASGQEVLTLERTARTEMQASLALDIPSAVERSYQSVGLVRKTEPGGAQTGSATYLGDGLWITNAHVVLSQKHGQFSITTKQRQTLAGKVIAVEYDHEPDLALIETQAVDLKPVPMADAAANIGDLVFPSGFDQGRLEWHTIWPAKVVDRRNSVGIGQRKGSISGNSGGPTFNARGELIAPLNANGGTHYGNGFGPVDGLGTTITVDWLETRRFLLPFRARIVAALAQCNPQSGQCQPRIQPQPQMYPLPQSGGMVPRPTIPSFKPPASDPTPTLPRPTNPTSPAIDYDRLAGIVIGRMADDARFKGPKGDTGPSGPQGLQGSVSEQQVIAISAAIMGQLKTDPTFRGPAGPPGRDADAVDVDQLTAKIKANLTRRFIVVNSAEGTVIDDETYQADEPFVLDVTRLHRAAAGK